MIDIFPFLLRIYRAFFGIFNYTPLTSDLLLHPKASGWWHMCYPTKVKGGEEYLY